MIPRVWQSLPVIARAVITGALAGYAGTLPWSLLVSANMKHLPSLPWAIPLTAVYLWFYWRYVTGSWWPSLTSAYRRQSSRAKHLSSEVWGADVSQFPIVTLATWLIMSGIVSGVVEETAFRGYVRGPIERHYGAAIAILIAGILFGFAHFTQEETSSGVSISSPMAALNGKPHRPPLPSSGNQALTQASGFLRRHFFSLAVG